MEKEKPKNLNITKKQTTKIVKNGYIFIIFSIVNIVAIDNSSGNGSWGIPLSFLFFLVLTLIYIVFWLNSIIFYLKHYNKLTLKDKLHLTIIHIPILLL